MIREDFEQLLAYHCAPTLSGIKSGSIFSIRHQEPVKIAGFINTYNDILNTYGVYLEALCLCDNRALIYVYRRSAVMAQCSREEMKRFLESRGYGQKFDLRDYLHILKARLKDSDEFPHEIGAFLGYPLQDIEAFIRFKGKEYKLNGYWKVYHDVSNTKRLFENYSRCRHRFCEKLSLGKNLTELVHAA